MEEFIITQNTKGLFIPLTSRTKRYLVLYFMAPPVPTAFAGASVHLIDANSCNISVGPNAFPGGRKGDIGNP